MFRHTPIVVAFALILAAFAVACGSGGKSTKASLAVAPRPSPGCSQAALPAGESEQTLTVGAGTGTYRQMVPSAAAAKKPLPLIIDIHGLGVTAALQALISGFETLGEQRGAFVLTPSGLGPAAGDNSSDFLTQLLDASEQRLCIDTARVFMDGISLGGDISSTVGCQLADRIAAIGLVSGIQFPATCHPSRPLPVMVFYGKLDTMMQYYGGIGYSLTHDPKTPAPPPPTAPPADQQGWPPVETPVAQWAAADGCAAAPEATQVSPHVELRVFGGCSGGSAVEFYVISDGQHAWPGTETWDRVCDFCRAIGWEPTQEIKATPLLWDFFMQHPLAQ